MQDNCFWCRRVLTTSLVEPLGPGRAMPSAYLPGVLGKLQQPLLSKAPICFTKLYVCQVTTLAQVAGLLPYWLATCRCTASSSMLQIGHIVVAWHMS